MANVKTTEEQRSFLFRCSDLTLGISPCQSVPNTPMNVGEPWATIGRAANHAGQHDNIATITCAMARKGGIVQRVAGSGDTQGLCASAELKSASHCVRNPSNLHAEKEARLRSQHFTFSRSRMGNGSSRCSCEGGSRGPASAIRFTLGAGRPA